MEYKKVSLVLIIGFLLSGSLFAQGGYNWGGNKPKGLEKYTLMKDNIDNNNFKEALPPFRWLYKNIPDLHVNLYKLGIKAYSKSVKKVQNQDLKEGYQDTVIMLYKERAKRFGKKGYCYNRICYYGYIYHYNNKSKYDSLYNYMTKSIKLNGSDIYYTYADFYIYLSCYKKRTGSLKNEDVIENYNTLVALADTNIQKGNKAQKWKEKKKKAQDYLSKCVNLGCDFASNNLLPKYKKDTTNLELAKRIYSIMKTQGCFDKEEFRQAADYVLKKEPNYKGLMGMAKRYKKNNINDKAIKYYKKAANSTEDSKDKAEAYVKLAELKNQQGNKSEAKQYAIKALEADPTRKGVHTFLGNLYFNAHSYCKSQAKDPVKARAVFLAAYERYKKAGNKQKMASAKKQFPAMSQIFSHGYKLGQKINTGCWMNEKVTIRKRP